MTHPGPWITPTTTRYAQACADPPAVPKIYQRMWEARDWDTVRFGGGTGPSDTLVSYGDTIPNLVFYSSAILPTNFGLSQGLQAYPLGATPAAKLVPYFDVPFPSNAINVEYETAAGSIAATPHTQCALVRNSTNIGLAANLDIYQLSTATPVTYTFLDPTALAANAGNLLASVPPATASGIFTGKQLAATSDTVVYLYIMHGQDVTPFPYIAGTVGQMDFPEIVPTVEYRGPRFRFIYPGLAPLRQFPRNDALGGSPRQGKTNGPTSVQGSTRQGWRGAYR